MARKRIKLPKRIAGIRIPKIVRKGPIGQFLNSSGGQVLIAEAIMLAAGALASKRSDLSSAAEAARHPIDSLTDAGATLADGAAHGTDRLRYALSEAVNAFRVALESGNAAGSEVEIAEELDSKKKRSKADRLGAAH